MIVSSSKFCNQTFCGTANEGRSASSISRAEKFRLKTVRLQLLSPIYWSIRLNQTLFERCIWSGKRARKTFNFFENFLGFLTRESLRYPESRFQSLDSRPVWWLSQESLDKEAIQRYSDGTRPAVQSDIGIILAGTCQVRSQIVIHNSMPTAVLLLKRPKLWEKAKV